MSAKPRPSPPHTPRKGLSLNINPVPWTLFINPRGDAEFVERVTSEAASATSPDDLRSRLAPNYPNVAVRLRSLAGERADVLYVYRDGHWVAD
jgi:hypothetical protein